MRFLFLIATAVLLVPTVIAQSSCPPCPRSFASCCPYYAKCIDCGPPCTDLRVDPNNCGACDNIVSFSQFDSIHYSFNIYSIHACLLFSISSLASELINRLIRLSSVRIRNLPRESMFVNYLVSESRLGNFQILAVKMIEMKTFERLMGSWSG